MPDKLQEVEVLLCTLERGRVQQENRKALLEDALEMAERETKEWKELRDLIVETANHVQINVAEQISSIVTLALQNVGFDYQFKVQFVLRRGTTEADLLFIKDGEECSPMESSGGGAIDIAAFAIRIALWSLRKDTNIFILDEPFKYLSADLQEAAGNMVKELAHHFNLQVIMVSHNEVILADNTVTLG